MSDVRKPLRLSGDAAIVLALAATAIPFAAGPEDQAERWVRVLRLHGQVGAALQSLGVGEAPLESTAESRRARHGRSAGSPGDEVDAVTRRAGRFARGRGSATIATVDVLFAVFEVYGGAFDRALYIRGTSREELLERLVAPRGAPTGASR